MRACHVVHTRTQSLRLQLPSTGNRHAHLAKRGDTSAWAGSVPRLHLVAVTLGRARWLTRRLQPKARGALAWRP